MTDPQNDGAERVPIITRSEYLKAGDELFAQSTPHQSDAFRAAKRKAHETYFRQFVTEQTLRHVEQRFDVETLAEALAKDVNLNSIALEQWDRLAWIPTEKATPAQRSYTGGVSGPFYSTIPMDDDAARLAGESVTRATLVCIAKETARQLVQRAREQAAKNAAEQAQAVRAGDAQPSATLAELRSLDKAAEDAEEASDNDDDETEA